MLAIDLGTGGPKVGAVGTDGQLLATAFTAVPTVHTPDGGSEQEVQLWWRGIRDSVHSFVADGAVRADDLIAVGVTGQYSSMVAVDRRGSPIGPCLMWSDHRGAPYAAQQVGGPVAGLDALLAAQAIRYAGVVPFTTGEDPLGHELFLKHERPEVYAEARALLEPVDYLGLLLTGTVAATPASQFLTALVDTRPGRPARYVPWLVRRLGRDPALLAPLRPNGSLLGTVLPRVADELGVPAGVPVVAGVPDFFAAYLGSGAVADYQAHLAVSTTSWISCRVRQKRVAPTRMMASIPGVAAGSYLVVNDQASAGFCLRWWLDRQTEVTASVGAPPPDFDSVLAAAASAPKGANGVIFLPWLRGEHSPTDERRARGGFVNVAAADTQATLSRALLEGVAMNSRWLLEAVDRFVGRRLPSLRILGGGAQSTLWCQVFADVLGRPVERVAEPVFAQLRGAAMLALVGRGETTVERAGALVPVQDRFLPEPGSSDTYDPLYDEFRALFDSLRRHYHRLNA